MTLYYSECSNNFGISGTRILTEKDTASLKVSVFVLFRYKQRENLSFKRQLLIYTRSNNNILVHPHSPTFLQCCAIHRIVNPSLM